MLTTENFKGKRFMSIKEAANDYFSGCVTEASLYSLARKGELPIVRVGRRVLVDVEKFKKIYA